MTPRVKFLLWVMGIIFVVDVFLCFAAAAAPEVALPYQRALTREARYQFGLDAPVPTMAAQIEQESGWNPEVCSTFACGLAQFTPATAAWISGAYKQLYPIEPFNPAWALRALAQYDHDLWTDIAGATDACSRWAMALAGYNGGPGWIVRDRKLCAAAEGCLPGTWFGHVERYTARSPAAARENRGYPRRILLKLQAQYATWGRSIQCSAYQTSTHS